MKQIIKNEKELLALVEELRVKILSQNQKSAVVIGLVGDLGAGKTTFAQYFLREAGVKGPITSPSFVLMKPYKISKLPGFKRAYHLDCYRLKNPGADFKALGLEEILADPANIVLIEWAEKIKKALSKNTIWIKFEHLSEKQRLVIFTTISR